MAEIIDTTETVRSYLRAMEADAGPWMGEGIWLSPQPTIAMRHWAPDAYQVMVLHRGVLSKAEQGLVDQLRSAATGLRCRETDGRDFRSVAETTSGLAAQSQQ